MLTSTVSDSESKLASAQSKVLVLKDKLLASSNLLQKSASGMASAEQIASDVRIKLQASEKSRGISTVLPNAKSGLTDHVAMAKKKTA